MNALEFIAQALNDFAATLPSSVQPIFKQTANNALTAVNAELAKVAQPLPTEQPYVNGAANHVDN